MNVTTEQRNGVEVMAVNGRLDSNTSAVFEIDMLKWIESPATHFVLDLSGVTFLSSAALRVLLTMAKRTARSGKKVALGVSSKEVQDVFKIANFTAIFKIEPTVDDAVRVVLAQA
jgi:anti-anti-sigma factor